MLKSGWAADARLGPFLLGARGEVSVAEVTETVDLQEIAAAAEAAARLGGEVAMRYFGGEAGVRSKSAHNLVTDADVAAEKAIAEYLLDRFPGHVMVGEESHRGDADAEHAWIVDPIDGTNNFAAGVPQFAVCVAYASRGVPQAGAVLHPTAGDLYLAARGGPATCNGEPIHVSSAAMDDSLVALGFYYDRGAMMESTLAAMRDIYNAGVNGIRRFGAAALDLCDVARGRYGGFFEYLLSPWDFAAAALIVESAGGRVTTCRGEQYRLAPTSLLATNGVMHDELLQIVQARAPE